MVLCISSLPAVHSVNIAAHRVLLQCGRRHGSFFGDRTHLSYGLRCFSTSFMRSAPEETTVVTAEAPETTAVYEKNEPESEVSVVVENSAVVDGKEDNGYSQKEALEDNQQPLKFLEDLDIKLDGNNTYPLLVLGGGGVVALSLLAGITGAIDSIPLVPKVLELVGLGYSIWFTTRYLIFKENRDEFVGKFEQIKQEIFGSEDD